MEKSSPFAAAAVAPMAQAPNVQRSTSLNAATFPDDGRASDPGR